MIAVCWEGAGAVSTDPSVGGPLAFGVEGDVLSGDHELEVIKALRWELRPSLL